MNAMMGAATSLPAAYYQKFSSQNQAVGVNTPNKYETEQSEDETLLALARQQTYDLQLLGSGWNGYDAESPSALSIRQAMHWLIRSYAECKNAGVTWCQPNVTASAEGEVVFEWWAEDRSLLIYVEGASATFHKSLRSDGPMMHTHGDAPLGEGQMELLRWFIK